MPGNRPKAPTRQSTLKTLLGMAQNFIQCDREQLLLMSPSLREWLPENHLAWFVIDAVKDIDLSPFYARYRQDGWGRAAYDPAMMVAIVLYAYAKGQRSSRGIERACVEDVAYRVIASNLSLIHISEPTRRTPISYAVFCL